MNLKLTGYIVPFCIKLLLLTPSFNDTVNGSDLDSVTLKAYKVKDCGQNLGSDDCIWDAKKNVLLPVLRLAIAEVAKEKKEEFCAKKIR